MAEIVLKPVPRERVYALIEPVTFQIHGGKYHVPVGFRTDGASIPRFAWITTGTPYDPRHIRAAVFHDYLYMTGETSRRVADGCFRHVLWLDGVGPYQRGKMFWALRLLGWIAWRRYRRQGGNNDTA